MKGEHLEKLASVLAVPLAAIVATTYQAEMERLSGGASRPLELSSSPPKFHICPQHQVLLVSSCQCGRPLLPFDRQTLPFTCGNCGMDWAALQSVPADQERIERETTLLAFYACFLSAGSPAFFASALRLISDRQGTPGRRPRPRLDAVTNSLEYLVGRLRALGLSPNDMQLSADLLQDRPSTDEGEGSLEVR